MDTSVTNEQTTISKEEFDAELNRATIDRRDADFSGKTLEHVSLSEKNIDNGLNFKGSRILGSVFMANTSVSGHVNFSQATIGGSFFFGRGRIIGNFDMRKVLIAQTVNLVGLNITGSLFFSDAHVQGFVSLAKAVILGDLDMARTRLFDCNHEDLVVRGDVYLKSAQVNGSLDLTDLDVSGTVSLESVLIRKRLLAANLKSAYGFNIKNAIFSEDEADFEGIDPEKIIK